MAAYENHDIVLPISTPEGAKTMKLKFSTSGETSIVQEVVEAHGYAYVETFEDVNKRTAKVELLNQSGEVIDFKVMARIDEDGNPLLVRDACFVMNDEGEILQRYLISAWPQFKGATKIQVFG